MTFSEAVTTIIGEAFTNIAKMIEKLTQAKDPEVPITDAGGASTSTMDVVEGTSLFGDSREELPSPTP